MAIDPASLNAMADQKLITYYFAAIVLCFLFRPWKLNIWRLWAVSVLIGIAGIASSIGVIQIASNISNLATQRGAIVRNQAELATEIRRIDPSNSILWKIPTGVQIQGFKFETALDLELHGFIWQKYPKDMPEAYRNFVVPEASGGNNQQQQLLRKKTLTDGSELAIYQFSITQRQFFAYERYPFDYQTLWFRLWAPDFESKVALLPDFDSYPVWEDAKLIGVDSDASIGGYKTDFSNWSIWSPQDQTTWGEKTFTEAQKRHGLFFNIGFHRVPAGSLFKHVVPILVTFLLCFASLLFVNSDETHSASILSFVGALLFAAIFNDQDIRSAINANGLTLVSWYSTILYVMLIYTAVNIIVIVKAEIKFIEWRNNLRPKLLFLPLSTLMVAVVTRCMLFS